jgi:hypothetical protein
LGVRVTGKNPKRVRGVMKQKAIYSGAHKIETTKKAYDFIVF